MTARFMVISDDLTGADGVAGMMARHCGAIVIRLIPADSKCIINTKSRPMNLILLKIALSSSLIILSLMGLPLGRGLIAR